MLLLTFLLIPQLIIAEIIVNVSKIREHLKNTYYLVNSSTEINNSAKWLNILHGCFELLQFQLLGT